MPSQSCGASTGNSTERVLASESTSKAIVRSRLNVVHRCQSGRNAAVAADVHERGERLVQPDAVPPAHRDQVAEPHVGQLVGDHVGQVLQLGLRRRGRVGQQQRLAVGDAARGSPSPRRRSRAGRPCRTCRSGTGCRSSPGTSVIPWRPTSRPNSVRWPLPGTWTIRSGIVPPPARGPRPARWPRAGRRRRRRGTCSSASSRRSATATLPLSSVGALDLRAVGHGEQIGLDDQRDVERPP